jgi:DNA-directed RNA polymerase specialized sigma24 family protein
MPKKQQGEYVEKKFDSYCKKSIRNERRDMYRAQKVQREREINFSDLSNSQLQSTPFQYWDAYEEKYAEFRLFNGKIVIYNEFLAYLLNQLSAFNRNIILMSIWLEMSDRQISELLRISRSAVQYKRTRILREMRKIAEEKNDDK